MLLKLDTTISNSSLPMNLVWKTITTYFHSSRQCSRDRRSLSAMNDYLLRDIGLTRYIGLPRSMRKGNHRGF